MWHELCPGHVSLLFRCGRLTTVPLLVMLACQSDLGSPGEQRPPAQCWGPSCSLTPSPPSVWPRGRSLWSSVWSSHPERHRGPGWGYCLCSPEPRRRSRRPWWRWFQARSQAPWPGWKCEWASSRPRTPPPRPPPAAWSGAGCGPSPESRTTFGRSSASEPWGSSTWWWWAQARRRQRQTRTPSSACPSTRTARGTVRHTPLCLQAQRREGGRRCKFSDEVHFCFINKIPLCLSAINLASCYWTTNLHSKGNIFL